MILIVDDYVLGATALARLIRYDGYLSQAVHSGLHALEMIRTLTPSSPLLCVFDYHMPEMDGIQLLRAVRAEPAIAGTSAIFYSSENRPEVTLEAERLGVNTWIAKDGAQGGFPALVDELARRYALVGGTRSHSPLLKSLSDA